MARRNNENTDISTILQEFVEKNKLQKGLDKVNVKDIWNSEMGAPIAKYTTAIKLDRGTLYVALSSSVLREELGYGKEKIISMLNKKLRKELIKKLVLR